MDPITTLKEKIFGDFDSLSQLLRTWKEDGNKIVFTNGCFDLIHRGHIDYLSRAAGLGDRLIVGLNSDDSVTRLKGKGRPLVDQDSRAFVLAALCFVDAVVLFSEDTPGQLIDRILPDVLVKGTDYTVPGIAGHKTVLATGGEVVTIPLVEGFSTSGLIDRIIATRS